MALVRFSRARIWLVPLLVATTAAAACQWIGPASASSSRPALGRWSAREVQASMLWSVSCPTSSFCMADGEGPGSHSPQGYVYTYSRGRWSRGRRLDRHTYQDTVSCASPSFCVLVDSLPQISPAGYRGGYAFSYSRGRWSRGRRLARAVSLSDVSCPTRSFCAATGVYAPSGGQVYTYSAGRWSHDHVLGRRQDPSAVSCTSRSFCLVVTTSLNGGVNRYATYSHGTWSPLHPVHTVDQGDLMSLSCASPQRCLAADDVGFVYIYSHGRWQPGHRIGSWQSSPSVSCTASSLCVAVDGDWADVLSGGRWSGHAKVVAGGLEAVSCARGPVCTSVGGADSGPGGLAARARSSSR